MTLQADDVNEGVLFWYSGRTSMWEWCCPGVITRVDREAGTFFVRSLDDMEEQKTPYKIDPNGSSSPSRQTMRVTSTEEVLSYLRKREEKLAEDIDRKVNYIEQQQKALQTMRASFAAMHAFRHKLLDEIIANT